ncbi:hypothetical protein [Streptomyces sp. N50]|uniref:hypothetical protein n=1 Tax=Streptomyces sp. N50 TaxID=3081765 RepID=UPI002962200D|nr:hypothetical protein [Streptomyces sp. N50]WOX13465.1 hypothetical protein R2B38_33595 [Streptomyces sp. N50]
MNSTARTLRSSATVAGAGLLLAATGAVLAPAATAATTDAQPPALTVSTAAPAEIGLAGQPVEFTTTASNVGTEDTTSARLIYHIDGGAGLPPNAVSLQYRLSGTAWKTVPLTLTGTQFSGELPESFALAAAQSRTVQLRLGLPMGTPHHGDSNGGADQLKLNTLISYGTSGAANDSDEDTVKVDGLDATLSGVPTTATAGGPGVTFGATVSNATASAYENVTGVLFTSRYATVQVLSSGTWKTLKPITAGNEPDVYGFDITGKDSSLAAHSSAAAKFRVSYLKNTPAGKTTVHPCAFVNQGSTPFTGTTFCGASASITVKAAASGTTTPTTSARPSTSATPTSSSTPSTSPTATTTTSSGTISGTTSGTTTQLARTGSGGISATAASASALITAGAGTLGFVALRRRRNRA